MLADRPPRQSLVAQVDQEGLEIRHDLLAWQKIFGQPHPASRPLLQLLAVGQPGGLLDGHDFVYRSWFCVPSHEMELTTIINHGYRFPGFVHERAKWSADKKSIVARVRPRAGSAAVCSGCHQPGRGYGHLDERRFEFIPFWGLLVFFLYRMRRVRCQRRGVTLEEVPRAKGKHRLSRACMRFLAHWARCRGPQDGAARVGTVTEKDPLAPVKEKRQPHHPATVPPARPAALQSRDCPGLSAQRRLSATLGV